MYRMAWRLSAVVIFTLITACGGSGGNSKVIEQAPVNLTGVFVDSPVAGLAYSAGQQSGVTDQNGRFVYRQGDRVSFSLGSIQLGGAPGAARITPLDLVGATDLDDAAERGLSSQVINLILFLQSLDRDHDPENGIDLGNLNDVIEGSIDFAQSTIAFQQSGFRELVNRHGGFYRDSRRAVNHLLASLGETTTVLLPSADFIDEDGDGVIDETVTFGYDDQGRLVTITSTRDAGVSTATISYDDAGRIVEISDESGHLGLRRIVVTQFEFDAAGRRAGERTTLNGELVREITAIYDETGNLLNVTEFSGMPVPLSLFATRRIFSPVSIPPKVKLPAFDLTLPLPNFGLVPDLQRLPIVSVVERTVTRDYEYSESGRLMRLTSTVGGASTTQNFDPDSNCPVYPATPGILNMIAATLRFNPASTLLSPAPILCDDATYSNGLEVDFSGRPLSSRQTIGNDLIESRFFYTGDQLSRYTSMTTRNGAVVVDSEFVLVFDDRGGLIEGARYDSGELGFRWVREYELREVSSIPEAIWSE